MKYDFTTILNRAGHDALAVDGMPMEGIEIKEGFDKIPMWVADMNYPVFPEIIEEVQRRLNEPHFGYFRLPEEYFNAIINWQKNQNDLEVAKEEIGYENGVLGAVSSALNAFTLPGEKILLHSPCYIGFSHVLEDTGREAVLSPLKKDDEGIWRMDYEDMEKKLKENHIHTVILCSPHNPSGRVWEKEELEKAMALFEKYDCLVLSDEIWSDIIRPGYKHIPTLKIDGAKDRTIAMYAPSKTFNLAGLVGSYHVIKNPTLLDRYMRSSQQSHYNGHNVLSVHALIGAFNEDGKEWVKELNDTIKENVDYALDHIHTYYPLIEVSKPQGTYMLYLDLSKYLEQNNLTLDEVLKKGIEHGVLWQDGRPFKMDNTIRLNLALPKSRVEEAFKRLDQYVFNVE